MHELDTGNIIRSTGIFNMLAKRLNAWDRITPGRFEIKKGGKHFFYYP
jgi:hypothetical protein